MAETEASCYCGVDACCSSPATGKRRCRTEGHHCSAVAGAVFHSEMADGSGDGSEREGVNHREAGVGAVVDEERQLEKADEIESDRDRELDHVA